MIGTMISGLTYVPLNLLSGEDQLKYVVEHCDKEVAQRSTGFVSHITAVLETTTGQENRKVTGMMCIGIAKIASEQDGRIVKQS